MLTEYATPSAGACIFVHWISHLKPMRGPHSTSQRPETADEHSSQEQDLSAIIGKTGPFHRTMLLYATFAMTVFSLHLLLHAVVEPKSVDHWCQLPQTPPNTTLEEWKKLNIPQESNGSFSRCLVYKEVTDEPLSSDNETRETMPCATRFFNVSEGTMSIVQEWDLVCDRQWLFSVASTTFFTGSLFGLILSGLFADRVGRKPVVCFAAVLLEVTGVSLFSAKNFVLFNTLRFLVAASVSAVSYTNYVLLVEFIALEHRALYGTFTYCGFSVGVVVGNVIAYLIREWRTAQLVIMVPTTLLLACFWLLPESPRWLITTLRIHQACGAVSLILRKNRTPPKSIRSIIKRLRSTPVGMLHQKGGITSPESVGKPSPRRKARATEFECPEKSIGELLVIFVTQYQLSNTVLCLTWFSCSVTFYGIGYDVSAQSTSNVSQFLVAAVAPLAAYLLISRRGRRDVLAGSLMCTSVCCILVALLPRDRTDRFLVILMAWFLINVAFTVVFLYATEIYPTIIRALGFNFGAAFGRLGSIIGPVFYDNSMMNTYESRMVGFSALSLSCVVSGFLVTKLPETMETHLPEKIKPEDNLFEFSPMWLPGSRRPNDTHEDANADTGVDSGIQMAAVLRFANMLGGITKFAVGESGPSASERPAVSSAVEVQPSSFWSRKPSMARQKANSRDNSAGPGAPIEHATIPMHNQLVAELSKPTSMESGRSTMHHEVETFVASGEQSSPTGVIHTASEPVLAATTKISGIREPLGTDSGLADGPPALIDESKEPDGRAGERDLHEPGSNSAGHRTPGQLSTHLRPRSSSSSAPCSTKTALVPTESAAIHAPDSMVLVPEPRARNLPPSSDGNALDRNIALAASPSSSPRSHGTPNNLDSGITSGVESPASRADMSGFNAGTATPPKVSPGRTTHRHHPSSPVPSGQSLDAATPLNLPREKHTDDAGSKRKRKKHRRRKH